MSLSFCHFVTNKHFLILNDGTYIIVIRYYNYYIISYIII